MDDPVSGGHVLEAPKPFLKNAPVRGLPGVGHYPQVEAAEEVAELVDEMVKTWRGKRDG